MLPKYSSALSGDSVPIIKKYLDGEDVSARGAFPDGKTLKIVVRTQKKLGVGGVAIRIRPDGGSDTDIPMSFCDSDGSSDTYESEIPLGKGLYYWQLVLVRGFDTLFSESVNNVDYTLSAENTDCRFRLLAYAPGVGEIPWLHGNIIYQIFPDRFARGNRAEGIAPRKNAVINPDWYGGIPQYAEKAGGEVENNVFFGGTLYGVTEKLDYLSSLGVGIIYLNPIFEAYSNHKYDTGDYEKVDGMFGGDGALDELIEKATEKGIRIILDGVFNHTGIDSRYFNRYGNYEGAGAYQSPESPYYDWYRFRSHPDDYECWWGIKILPRLNHTCPECRRYFTGKDGIAEKYIKRGVSGWRLDVADELSDEFLDEFRDSVKQASGGDAVIIGEVWENAADKVAYGKRRRYLSDGQLDSVMNYPFRNAVISYCTSGDAGELYDTLTEIYASYPPAVCDSLMNIVGTHDTERILTVLGTQTTLDATDPDLMSMSEKATFRLGKNEYDEAKKLLKIASTIQYTTYGVPSLYYGDEAGTEGFGDPFCRRPYPWGREDEELLDHYKKLGEIRRRERVYTDGSFKVSTPTPATVCITREKNGEKLLTLCTRERGTVKLDLDGTYTDLFSGGVCRGSVTLAPDTAVILKKSN